MAMVKSIESQIQHLTYKQLDKYHPNYKQQNESLNDSIDKALKNYDSKSGGTGGNIPEAKLLLPFEGKYYPVLIECKGIKGKLEKLDNDNQVENLNSKKEPFYKNISGFAVNGAVHYSNALLHYTNYENIIAIGVNGYKNDFEKIVLEVAAYYVSKDNLGIGQKIGNYTDLSFLKDENNNDFFQKIKELKLSDEEKERLKERREAEIDVKLTKLNNDIYKDEKGLSEADRVYLVSAVIMATLGIGDKDKEVSPLDSSELKSSMRKDDRDGDIIYRRVDDFLSKKGLPEGKRNLVLSRLSGTLCTENINRPISVEGKNNDESQLKRIFNKIVKDLGLYYKMGLTTDFTGKLFNEMYRWLGFTQDKLNDVVLTPSYVSRLLVKLCNVNKDSYVWDFATGSAGLLVAAMNEMLNDAKNRSESPEEYKQKELKIKSEQLLGLELLPNVYILAVLNMILMGDGSSNILNEDSLCFNGEYGYKKGSKNDAQNPKFPATAFVLNPPYSAKGCGMVFVEKALNMMDHGLASIIIQSSAGSGKAKEYNKRILKRNKLLASIKMPSDLFSGKSDVQTRIYVFRVNEPHQKDDVVKFIDFSNDGYTRTNRKKASNNLIDSDRAKERYKELISLVHNGSSKLNIFTEDDFYESTVVPDDGADWNKTKPIDIQPTLEDFKKTVGNYLSWEVSNLIDKKDEGKGDLGKTKAPFNDEFKNVKWGEFKIKDLFVSSNGNTDIKKKHINGAGIYVITSGLTNNGILGKSDIVADVFNENTITVDMFGNCFYRSYKYKMVTHARVFSLKPILNFNREQLLFLVSLLHFLNKKFNYNIMCSWRKIKDEKLLLPIDNFGNINIQYMEKSIKKIEIDYSNWLESDNNKILKNYLSITGLNNYKLTQEEQYVLNKFKNKEILWKEFKLKNLFKINPTKYYKNEKPLKIGTYPVISNTSNNNGVVGFSESIPNNVGNSITCSDTTLGAETMFYQKSNFIGYSHIQHFVPKVKNFNKFVALFFITSSICATKNKYNYGIKFNRDAMNNTLIYLPIKNDGNIDFKFLETFISVIQKLVIKDIVLLSNKKLELTKKIINKDGNKI